MMKLKNRSSKLKRLLRNWKRINLLDSIKIILKRKVLKNFKMTKSFVKV